MKQNKNNQEIEFRADGITVDAEVIADELGLEPSAVPLHMHEGEITSICERGTGQDDGLHRLTFFYFNRRLRLVIGPDGKIRSRSLLNFGDRPLPALARRLK